uniref:Fanconi anemia group D2 protein n=1 Tax=Setaria digitata TaxID=48799 RepID=A0A915PTL1_9BILA
MYRPRRTRTTSVSRKDSNQFSMDDAESVPATPPLVGAPPQISSEDDSLENDYSVLDEREFRRALDRCYTQSQNTNVCKLNFNKLPARNTFERLLEEIGVELCTTGDDEISIYLSSLALLTIMASNNFQFVAAPTPIRKNNILVIEDDKRANFFDLFEEEIIEESKLRMYLSPCATETGYVDTFIRILLMSNSSQAITFELIIRKIETYAKSVSGDNMKSDWIPLACIAQFRYLDNIFDCRRIFNAIFDCNLECWHCTPRDALIQILPEILPSHIVQQDTANNLQQMFFRGIRGIMLQNIMKLDGKILPELMTYCLGSIHKNEKFAFRNVLVSLRTHLEIENLKIGENETSAKTAGGVLTEIFEIIIKKVRTGDGHWWRDAVTVLTTEVQRQDEGKDVDGDIIEFTDFVPLTRKMPVLFDVLLSFALMDVNNWSHMVYSFFKHQISCNQFFQLGRLIVMAFEYTEFTTRFFRPIQKFFENLMWSAIPIYMQFAAHGYKTLFLKLPSKQAVIFDHILQHLNGTEQEATATLVLLQDIAENHNDEIANFFLLLSKKIPYLINFSFDNICRFFNILLSMERVIEKPQTEKVVVETAKMRLSTEDRESMLKQKLALLDERTNCNIYLRTCFYEHFAKILNTATKIGHSTVLIIWSERLCVDFRRDYLKERSFTQCRLEDERYRSSPQKEWLCLSELVERTTKIQLDSKSPIFEPMLNTFAVSDTKTCGVNTESFRDTLRKRFALMMECQKSLKYTIQKIGEYRMPYIVDFGQTELIVFHDIHKKSSSTNSRKKRTCIGRENNESDNEKKYIDDGEKNELRRMEDKENKTLQRDVEKMGNKTAKAIEFEQLRMISRMNLNRRRLVAESQLIHYFMPLRFAAVIYLIELLPKKRKQTTFLLDTLSKLFEELLPKGNKKILPMLTVHKSAINEKCLEDDNVKVIWPSIQSIVPTLFTVLRGAVDYFKNLLDTSTVIDPTKRSYHSDMCTLLHSSLVLFYNIFSSRDFVKTAKDDLVEEMRSHHLKMERRKSLMEKLERAMINDGAVEDTEGVDDTEDVVSSYFISLVEVVPTLNCAVSLLHLLSCDFVDARQKSRIAKMALTYLKKEWFDIEGKPMKGASLNQAVASILRLYISFREQTERLSAIQWILANKVSELVPEDERRRSKISSLEPCYDKDLNEDGGSPFICFSKATFPSIYKLLFCSLNETTKNTLSLQAVENGKLQQDKCFALWRIAASSFCLLTLLIRELRNASVLLTAAREGRIFLQSFVVKSSFMYLLSDETRFARYGAGANAILKTVQIGNRSLQNMNSHAKSTKCSSLLKLLPQLRATSEQFIRAVHQLMIGVNCDGAFQIGLLKSRNLDGEELKEIEMQGDSSAEGSQQRSVIYKSGVDDIELAEEKSDVEMDLDDESPIF